MADELKPTMVRTARKKKAAARPSSRTAQWIKKLGGHAGELYVCAELSKRGIPNALLPENFSDDDILVGDKEGTRIGYVQVKSCHPDRAGSFLLGEASEKWTSAPDNTFCVFVWLGSPKTNEPPRYWVALKSEVGQACREYLGHMGGARNWERRFWPDVDPGGTRAGLPADWADRWSLFDDFQPGRGHPPSSSGTASRQVAEPRSAELESAPRGDAPPQGMLPVTRHRSKGRASTDAKTGAQVAYEQRMSSPLAVRLSKDGVQFCECLSCVHVHDDMVTCEAFPDGIPSTVLTGELLHTQGIDGDAGLRYEQATFDHMF